MKKIAGISVLAALAITASCDKTIDYEYVPFALLETESFQVREDAGTLTIPVTLYNAGDKDVSLTVAATPDADCPATEGIDYVITEPASGILVFAPGETSKNITVSVIDRPGEYTGTLGFSIAVGSGTDGVNMGTANSCHVTIYDYECMSPWLGTWSAAVTDYWGDVYDMSLTISDNGANNVTIAGLSPVFLSRGREIWDAAGTISDDGETLTIATGQRIGWRNSGVAILYVGMNSSFYDLATDFADIVLTIDTARRTITFTNAWGTTNAVAADWRDLFDAPLTLEGE